MSWRGAADTVPNSWFARRAVYTLGDDGSILETTLEAVDQPPGRSQSIPYSPALTCAFIQGDAGLDRTVERNSVSPERKTTSRRADCLALGILLALTAVVMIHRWIFDDWVSRHDLLAFFIPWYGYLGDRLAAGDIPGWNPYLFGGSPFAGDPESGWMYLPAMLLFPFLYVVTAYKFLILLQLLIAGTATYAFGRVLGFGAAAALLSAIVYEFGPFLIVQTDCCTVAGQLSTWVPVAFLGVELALRARDWVYRSAAWFLAGLGISQMVSGWVGQGAVNGLLIVAGWIAYRAVLSPPVAGWPFRTRVVLMVTTGLATIVIGLGIGAAGLLPRLAVNAQSFNPGGTYENIPGAFDEAPYVPWWLIRNLISSGFDLRQFALGGVVIVLALLALFVARKRYATPFFAGLFLVICILSLGPTLLHRVFFLIPMFEEMHTHSPRRLLWLAPIGPAMLAGAAIQVLPELRSRLAHRWAVFLPLLILIGGDLYVTRHDRWAGWQTYVTAGLTTLAIAVAVYARSYPIRELARTRIVQAMTVGIIALAFVVPNVQDIAESINDPDGLSLPNNLWQHNPTTQTAIDINLSREDTGGAGEFLQRQQETQQPFRYVGYSGSGYRPAPSRSYPDRRLDAPVIAILQNARPFRLGIESIQGYNPLQLKAWYDWITALNREPQNYHFTDLWPVGFGSPLLDMTNVRYILVDRFIPPNRDDVVALTQGKTEVYRNNRVVVYENPDAYPRAWIVHDVRPAESREAMAMFASGQLDGRIVALVQAGDDTPSFAPSDSDHSGDSVSFTHYEPDRIEMRSTSSEHGFLVMSEVFEEGWKAWVDGDEVEVHQTNGAFRGLVLPAGDHVIVMEYKPTSLAVGMLSTAIFSIAGIGVFAYAGLYAQRGRRHVAVPWRRKRPVATPDLASPETA